MMEKRLERLSETLTEKEAELLLDDLAELDSTAQISDDSQQRILSSVMRKAGFELNETIQIKRTDRNNKTDSDKAHTAEVARVRHSGVVAACLAVAVVGALAAVLVFGQSIDIDEPGTVIAESESSSFSAILEHDESKLHGSTDEEHMSTTARSELTEEQKDAIREKTALAQERFNGVIARFNEEYDREYSIVLDEVYLSGEYNGDFYRNYIDGLERLLDMTEEEFYESLKIHYGFASNIASYEGFTVMADETKPDTVTFNVENKTDMTFTYGAKWFLEEEINGEWTQVESTYDTWNAWGAHLEPNSTESITVDLNEWKLNGKPGKYRLYQFVHQDGYQPRTAMLELVDGYPVVYEFEVTE